MRFFSKKEIEYIKKFEDSFEEMTLKEVKGVDISETYKMSSFAGFDLSQDSIEKIFNSLYFLKGGIPEVILKLRLIERTINSTERVIYLYSNKDLMEGYHLSRSGTLTPKLIFVYFTGIFPETAHLIDSSRFKSRDEIIAFAQNKGYNLVLLDIPENRNFLNNYYPLFNLTMEVKTISGAFMKFFRAYSELNLENPRDLDLLKESLLKGFSTIPPRNLKAIIENEVSLERLIDSLDDRALLQYENFSIKEFKPEWVNK